MIALLPVRRALIGAAEEVAVKTRVRMKETFIVDYAS